MLFVFIKFKALYENLYNNSVLSTSSSPTIKSLDEKFSFCKIIKFYIWMEATVPCNAFAVYRDEVSKVVARE
jgi:hypothetical protein